jgi:thiol-disulfide isomerase/thioredoxin
MSKPSVQTGSPWPGRLRRWSRDIALVLLVVFAVQWWHSRNLVEGTAPPLVGLTLDGSSYQLDPSTGVTLVHFWAEWCPVCRFEQDSIDRIAKDHRVITVATTSGEREEVQAYVDEHGLGMPVVVDNSGKLARSWGVQGTPSTFIVDEDGVIVFASTGYSTEIGLRLRLWLAKL